MYPLKEIIFLIEFIRIKEVSKVIGESGMIYTDDLTQTVEFKITNNNHYNENIIHLVTDIPQRMEKPFLPHESWDDLMFTCKNLHDEIHIYMDKCKNDRQKEVCDSLHTLMLLIEISFATYKTYTVFHNLCELIKYCEENKSVLTTIKSNEPGEERSAREHHI